VRGIVLVALGGAAGSALRYLTALIVARWLGGDVPWGTVFVNLSGSFLIGLVHELGGDAAALAPETRLFLATGLLGGFTTYSAFSYETARLLQAQAWWAAALYTAAMAVGCVALCLVGMAVARSFLR
jgi:CrcB protein